MLIEPPTQPCSASLISESATMYYANCWYSSRLWGICWKWWEIKFWGSPGREVTMLKKLNSRQGLTRCLETKELSSTSSGTWADGTLNPISERTVYGKMPGFCPNCLFPCPQGYKAQKQIYSQQSMKPILYRTLWKYF